MPWWSWVLVWTALVVTALAVAAVLAVHLWRRALGLAGELLRASETLGAALPDPSPSAPSPPRPPGPRP